MSPDGGGPGIPIIEINGCLTVSLHDHMDDRLARRLLDDVGARVRHSRARALVIDVSAVDIMDSFLAASIRDAAALARLMGVRTMVSGLSPAIAITLLDMGVEMRGVATTRDLDQALHRLRGEVEQDQNNETSIAAVLGRAPAPQSGAKRSKVSPVARRPPSPAKPASHSEHVIQALSRRSSH